MNEAKEIERHRAKLVTRKNSRAVEIAVWGLLLVELWRTFGADVMRYF
jgi:hypothetical protein